MADLRIKNINSVIRQQYKQTQNSYIQNPIKNGSQDKALPSDVYGVRYPYISPISFGAKLVTTNSLHKVVSDFSQSIKNVDLDLIFSDIRGLQISEQGIINIPEEFKSFKSSLNRMIQFFPEFVSTIGKQQHFPHKYNLDGHLLTTVQNCVEDNEYANLSESSKRVLTISAFLHDIAKEEGVVDKFHPVKSAEMAKEILERQQLTDEEQKRIHNIIKNHHWVEELRNGKKEPKSIAEDMIVPEDFNLLKIIARADLESFGHKASINKYKDAWIYEAQRIEAELKPQTKAVNAPTTKVNFNYPKKKPSERDGFYYYENNPLTSREFLRGQTAYIEYIDKSKQAQATIGTVTRSTHAVWEVTNHETGKVYKLNTNWDNIKEIWLKPSEEKLEDILLKSIDPVGYLEHVSNCRLINLAYDGHVKAIQTITSCEKPFGVIQSQNNGKPFVLTGRFSVVEPVPDYSVIQVETDKGEKYLYDLNYASKNTKIAINVNRYNPELENYQISHGKPVSIIDTNRQKRVGIVNALMKEVYVNKESPFELEKFYNFLSKDLEQTRKLINQWYGEKTGRKLIQQIEQNLGEKDIVLLGDPGIASRVDSLIKFAKTSKLDLDKASPYELREKFSKHLGVSKIYRGMAITEQQASIIQNNGLLAPGLLDSKKTKEALFNLLDTDSLRNQQDAYNSGYYIDQIIARVDYGRNNDNIYSSCSKYKDVASSIGWYSQKKDKQGIHPYLIEMNVPTISIIEQRGIFDNLTNLGRRIGERFSVGKGNIYKSNDPNLEVFIPFAVNPKNYKIYQTDKPLRWYGEASPNFNTSVITED